jgi:dihydrolipoamide dehydrogenase
MSKKILVIGGGPGGYVAAIRAAQLGAQVALVENEALGGTCLNRGCIPTKALLHSVELYRELSIDGPELGLLFNDLSIDFSRLMTRKTKIISRLVGGVEMLLKSRGVLIIPGRATLKEPKEALVIKPNGGRERVAADAVILATGSVPSKPPVPGFDLDGVITSDEALSLKSPPKSMVIVGGGVIGIELASVYAALGTVITVVEFLPRILNNVDEEIVRLTKSRLEALGLKIHTGALVKKVEKTSDGLKVFVENAPESSYTAEKVLVAAGRKPNTADLGLEELGVRLDRSRIKTDERMATNIPGLYAIGDCSSPIMLAHVASREGEVAVENIMGHKSKIDYRLVPGAIYTNPEIAWVGLTEAEAKEQGYSVTVGKFPLAFNGKSLVMGVDGLFKTVVDQKNGSVLGVHLLGPRATDLIGQAVLSMQLEATTADLEAVIHAHPTVSEALGESLLDALKRAVHKI